MTTSAISGNFRSRCSIRLLMATDSVREMPGSLRVSTRIEPSSSLGMNSVPMKYSEPSATAKTISDTPTRQDAESHGASQHADIDAAERPNHPCSVCSPVSASASDASPKAEGRKQRHHRQREQQRARQSRTHRDRHGPKHAPFQALQEQDRQVDRDDDDHGECHRAGHFLGGVPHRFKRRLAAVLLLQPVDRVLHHHHRSVHDHSEIDRAQAHQVRADAEQAHAQKADQHRERNDRGRDQRSPQIAEKQEQHDGHQHKALEQVLLDGVDRAVDHEGLIVERNDLDARRQVAGWRSSP